MDAKARWGVSDLLMRSTAAALAWLVLVAPAPGQDDLYEPKPGDLESDRLGIFYQLVPYGNGKAAKILGARGFANPLKPIGLEPGDLIVAIDDQPIRTEQDLETHYSRTSVTFRDVRTGQVRKAWIDLPGQPVAPALDPAGLRAFAAQALRDGSVPYSPPTFEISGDVVISAIGVPDFNAAAPAPVQHQFEVEIIRLTRSQPNQRAFWEPYLGQVEAVIRDEVGAWNQGGGLDFQRDRPFQDRIDAIYKEAFEANARAIGKRYQPPAPQMQGAFIMVRLMTPGNQGTIYLMPRTKYLIRRLDAMRRPIQLIEFDSATPDTERNMAGDYVYKIVYPNGAETPLRTLRAEKSGPLSLQ